MPKVDKVEHHDRSVLVSMLEDAGLHVVEWTDAAGVSYPEHAHGSREIRIVLDGSMTVSAGATVHVLGPGDRIELAPDEPHSAVVGDAGVRYLAATDARPPPEYGVRRRS
jgi:quercetin dioxygenase-like cupin family protein